jgi:hypothetical protein
MVRTVSPVIEGKLIYLRRGTRTVAVRAGGEIPSRAYAVGAGLDLHSGRWDDSRADSVYIAPTAHQLYNELDRFHIPPRPDSTWGEWHYFNLVTGPDEWWYITYLIGGEIPTGTWGGQLLVTRRRPGGQHKRFSLLVSPSQVAIDTLAADLTIGGSTVRQRDGIYHLQARVPGRDGVSIDVDLAPVPHRYFPPVELREEDFLSGYVVPALEAKASGKICIAGRCHSFTGVPAYHDHNWGIWRDVTWEWGAGRGTRVSLLYGGVYGPQRERPETGSGINSPFFLTLADSLGVKQVLRFIGIKYQGARPVPGSGRITAPTQFTLVGTRDADTVRIEVQVGDVLATEMQASKLRRTFLQMRGRFSLAGRVAGETIADSGTGFFETYVPVP